MHQSNSSDNSLVIPNIGYLDRGSQTQLSRVGVFTEASSAPTELREADASERE